MRLGCFKAYDVRGRLGVDLDEEIAYRIGRAYAEYLGANRVAVGCDVRLSSEPLKQALAIGLMDAGADVIDLGMTGSEEVYFAAFHLDVDGAIEVTASHNPIDYNGMKFVGKGAQPISRDSGLDEIKALAEANRFKSPAKLGRMSRVSILDPYVEHLLSYIDSSHISPLRLVVNPGNGAAGHVIDAIEQRFNARGVPIEFVKVQHEPDGRFPNGIPNPLLPENRTATREAVIRHQADMGIAWDGDFDRCFLFDEGGEFVEGYYIVGLLAEALLQKAPGQKIVHDPRLTWNTIDVVCHAGGVPIQSKTGHAFIKERMRDENAVYGGEMSGHHYFRDFSYCDSGMIPWLLMVDLLSRKRLPLSSLVYERMNAYPCSGELNYRVDDVNGTLQRIRQHFSPFCVKIENIDGLSMEFEDWRFNIRMSNTEPLLRLNVESKGDERVVRERVREIESLLEKKERAVA